MFGVFMVTMFGVGIIFMFKAFFLISPIFGYFGTGVILVGLSLFATNIEGGR